EGRGPARPLPAGSCGPSPVLTGHHGPDTRYDPITEAAWPGFGPHRCCHPRRAPAARDADRLLLASGSVIPWTGYTRRYLRRGGPARKIRSDRTDGMRSIRSVLGFPG